MGTTALYVHGSFVRDPEWWWRPVAERLEARGIESRTVTLPSCGETPAGDLLADAAAVREALAAIDGPVVVVGHSYGGMAITEGAAGAADVGHLVYVAATVPDVGQSLFTSGWVDLEAGTVPEVDIREDGTVAEIPDKWAGRLLSALPAEVQEEAKARLTRQAGSAYGQETTAAAWRDIPSTYVICLDDGDVTLAVQRAQAERSGGTVVELASNHFPQLEQPDELARIVREAAAALDHVTT